MDDTSRCGEVRFAAPRSVIRERNANLEVRADGHVEACQKSRAAAPKIFTGSIFLHGDAESVAERYQIDRGHTVRTLFTRSARRVA